MWTGKGPEQSEAEGRRAGLGRTSRTGLFLEKTTLDWNFEG